MPVHPDDIATIRRLNLRDEVVVRVLAGFVAGALGEGNTTMTKADKVRLSEYLTRVIGSFAPAVDRVLDEAAGLVE